MCQFQGQFAETKVWRHFHKMTADQLTNGPRVRGRSDKRKNKKSIKKNTKLLRTTGPPHQLLQTDQKLNL